ncbi:MAG TPA: winged helix DNA-binding domain-containing protein [Jatrophihabitans sp.]
MIAERMARHGLTDRPCTTVPAAAAHTVAIQAQDLAAARLGVRSRSAAVTEADVTAALAGRAVVRTWLMRNTIHLVRADDVRWLMHLFGPMIRRRFAKRWADLGITAQVLAQVEALAPELLSDGPLTRHEFAAQLRERRVIGEVEPQVPVHLFVYLATVGLTCHTDGAGFALLDEWLPDAAIGPRGDDALAELARRYFLAFSPATPADFTTWSGLPSGRAVALIRDELTEVSVNGKRGYRLGAAADPSAVRLLGAFDNFLIGYRDRTGLVPEDRRAEIYVGGIIRPTIVRDGTTVGRWRLDRTGGRLQVRYFVPASRTLRAAVQDEIADVARFIDRPLEYGELSVDM